MTIKEFINRNSFIPSVDDEKVWTRSFKNGKFVFELNKAINMDTDYNVSYCWSDHNVHMQYPADIYILEIAIQHQDWETFYEYYTGEINLPIALPNNVDLALKFGESIYHIGTAKLDEEIFNAIINSEYISK